jgi:hypothetical protein
MNTKRIFQKIPRALTASLLLAAALAGCAGDGMTGYTARNQYRGGIRTIAVPIWTRGKDVYRRDVELRLTKALIARIEQDTPYKTTVRERADTLLTGTIDQISQQTLSFNPDTGQPRELQVVFTVSFTWEDLRTGKEIVSRKDFQVADVYLPGAPFEEDFFRGSESLMDELARRIVETLEDQWPAPAATTSAKD